MNFRVGIFDHWIKLQKTKQTKQTTTKKEDEGNSKHEQRSRLRYKTTGRRANIK